MLLACLGGEWACGGGAGDTGGGSTGTGSGSGALDNAHLTWRGDFSSGDFSAFQTFQCGGPDGSCPGGHHGTFPTENVSKSDATRCSNPDDAGCRMQLVSPAPMSPSGTALRVTVASGGSPGAGDYDANFHGPRNELVNARESGGKTTYTEGDERYFAWDTLFPDGSDAKEGNFPDPPHFCSDPACAPSGFNVFFQLHQEGVCGGPPISLGLVRADIVNPQNGSVSQNSGDVYHMVFNATEGTYTGETPRLWPPLGHTGGIVKGGWYSFILHVRWGKQPCQGACNSPDTFNGGVLELWVREPGGDWTYAWPGPKKSAAHATTYDWPGSGDVCSADGDAPRSGSMPQNLKIGLYRDVILQNRATIYTRGLVAGTTCGAVNSGGCPPRG